MANAARYARHAKHVVLAHAAASTTHTQVATGRDVVGVTLYTYISEWHWGYNGSIVTSAGHSEYPGGTAPLWNYNGSVYLAPAGSVGSWYVGRQTQGKFTLSLPIWGVVQTSYATMWNYVNGAGGWSGSWTTSGI